MSLIEEYEAAIEALKRKGLLPMEDADKKTFEDIVDCEMKQLMKYFAQRDFHPALAITIMELTKVEMQRKVVMATISDESDSWIESVQCRARRKQIEQETEEGD